MGLQLIFVVETNKKCKSDWIYIKDTIDYFYNYDQAQVKLSPVYMDGKGKYRNKDKEIKSLISQYAVTKNNQSKVIFCFDCDDYDSKPEDSKFLEDAKKYCTTNGYDFVWFCKDIERVYLGNKVADSQKRDVAAKFKAKKAIKQVDRTKLTVQFYRSDTSNIMNVIDKYLERK